MVLFLSGLLSYFAAPLHWIILFLVLGFLTKNAGRKKIFLILSAIIIVVFSNNLIFKMAAGAWEIAPKSELEMEKKYDFAILPAYSVSYIPEKGITDLTGMSSEILKVVELYEKNYIRRILITGKTREMFSGDQSDADLLAKILMDADIPERKIYIENTSENLHENAVYSKARIDSIDEKTRNLLVISAVKGKRAKACFYQERMDLDVYPVSHMGLKNDLLFYEYVIPDHRTLVKWHSLLNEIFGFYMYALLGYV